MGRLSGSNAGTGTPDENEAFENLDEALDEADAQRGFIGGPEGQRDLDSDLVVDQAELQEAGAELDDPEQMALLDGGMDVPDGKGRRKRPRDSSNVGDASRPVSSEVDAWSSGLGVRYAHGPHVPSTPML